MRTSFRLGSIAGIRIDVNYSWLIIFALLTFSLATGWFPQAASGYSTLSHWIVAAIAVILFFASVLAHELAHSLVARSRGMPVRSITLFIFGGVSNIEREPQSAGDEFQMAFVGPLTSLILGGALLLVAFLLGMAPIPSPVLALFSYVGVANLLVGVFNLIPGFPMDGGRVLRAIIWKATGSLARATRWAVNVGQAVAYLMILAGVWLFFTGFTLDGLWIGFVGLFLLQAAQSELAQMQLQSAAAGVNVGDIMTAPPATITPDTSVQRLVDEHLLRTGQRAIPVVEAPDSQRLLGIVTLRDVRGLARERWDVTTVGQILTPLAQLKTVQAGQPLAEALPLITQAGVNQLPVMRDGQLVGMLDLEAIVRRLEVSRTLGIGADVTGDRRPQRPQLSPPRPSESTVEASSASSPHAPSVG
ncbi:MAG TPA: site-2 protease family protein [Ktedonobacterales bacterium]